MLYQNVEGSINMGVFFSDPDVELDDIFWYNALAIEIEDSIKSRQGLCSIDSVKLDNTDRELKTYSCYVELHRTGFSRPTDNLCKMFCMSMDFKNRIFLCKLVMKHLSKPSSWNKWWKQYRHRYPHEVPSCR